MSRPQLARYLVTISLFITCISGCQYAKDTKRTLSSYRFVDTTTQNNSYGTEKVSKALTSTNLAHPEQCTHTVDTSKKLTAEPEIVIVPGKKIYLTVTAYCPCATCCGWRINRYGNPVYNYGSQKGSRKKIGYTSKGTRADIGTIAADPRSLPYGTRLEVPGYGFGIIEDTGGALKGRHIDIFFHSHREAMKWGVKKLEATVWPASKAN